MYVGFSIQLQLEDCACVELNCVQCTQRLALSLRLLSSPCVGTQHARSILYIREIMDSDEPPTIHVRWFQVGVPQLLSITPITLNSTITWRPLTRRESDACEKAWLTSRKLQGYRSHESLIDNTKGTAECMYATV